MYESIDTVQLDLLYFALRILRLYSFTRTYFCVRVMMHGALHRYIHT